ncbi:MAG: 23S rRNA (adenine(2503)-C(2))-methyltransferase RlmN, partial [Clostridia bacterium]|nr:23S rRNA (adenine(2503)-C(2))-methyltransferase RlmN [Clostridia bacterium]
MKRIIQDLNYNQISELVVSLGQPKFRAKQLFLGITQGKRISEISVLPQSFRELLLNDFEDCPVEIIKTLKSEYGTEKYLFRLADGNIIEGVLMRYKYG